MSAPSDLIVVNSLDGLAPQFRRAVAAAIIALDVDAYVYESTRTQALQTLYYERGASKAASVLYSWHGYALAVDVISRNRQWDAWDDPAWSGEVVAAFKDSGCSWGGDWVSFQDRPHFQWRQCKPTPSDEARALLASSGVQAVWAAVGAA